MGELPLFVRYCGEVYPVTVHPDDDVKALCAAAAEAVGRTVATLTFQGAELRPDDLIADAGLSAQAVVDALALTQFRQSVDSEGRPVHFDENGLLYWLGSLGKTEDWANPVARQLAVCQKWPQWGCNPLEWIARRGCYCRTDNELDPWMMVHLLYASLQVTHYTLRHGRDEPEYVLKSWEFQGSNDGDSWTVLDVREEDETLRNGLHGAPPYHTGHWECNRPEARSASFSYFRIVSKGNWSPDGGQGEKTFLHLSGLELYGAASFEPGWEAKAKPVGDGDAPVPEGCSDTESE
eukprot:TRINITY_DN24899_c0_g4_i1.p1 TRINITY_DN24899_c0_g4~~TRINITY_DN24899_c0_g4_i1.p1  ORF type:complete len:326 (+),score=36.84 TRINITY_DN24899_c0_g4_i1:100-978(+)